MQRSHRSWLGMVIGPAFPDGTIPAAALEPREKKTRDFDLRPPFAARDTRSESVKPHHCKKAGHLWTLPLCILSSLSIDPVCMVGKSS